MERERERERERGGGGEGGIFRSTVIVFISWFGLLVLSVFCSVGFVL